MLVCPGFSSDNLSKHRTTIRTIKEEGSLSLPFYTMLRSPGRNRVSKIWLYAITKVLTLYFVIIGLGNLNSCRCEWKYTSTCCLLRFLSKCSLKLVLSLYFVTWRQLSLSKIIFSTFYFRFIVSNNSSRGFHNFQKSKHHRFLPKFEQLKNS